MVVVPFFPVVTAALPVYEAVGTDRASLKRSMLNAYMSLRSSETGVVFPLSLSLYAMLSP